MLIIKHLNRGQNDGGGGGGQNDTGQNDSRGKMI